MTNDALPEKTADRLVALLCDRLRDSGHLDLVLENLDGPEAERLVNAAIMRDNGRRS